MYKYVIVFILQRRSYYVRVLKVLSLPHTIVTLLTGIHCFHITINYKRKCVADVDENKIQLKHFLFCIDRYSSHLQQYRWHEANMHVLCAGNRWQRLQRLSDTCEHTLKKNHTSVQFVMRDLQRKAVWNDIWSTYIVQQSPSDMT